MCSQLWAVNCVAQTESGCCIRAKVADFSKTKRADNDNWSCFFPKKGVWSVYFFEFCRAKLIPEKVNLVRTKSLKIHKKW